MPGNELIMQICPVGGCEGKFYINKDTGLWDCKKCQSKGNLFKFKSLYGVVEGVISSKDLIGSEFKPMDSSLIGAAEAQLWSNQNAIDYLRGRGFNDETIRHFHLGYMQDAQGEWIAIPYIQDGKLWNFKYRRFAGGEKTFKRIKDRATVLFNIDGIDYTKGGIVAVEGEMDAMAAWQMGVTNVIGMTAGAGTFKPEWMKVFSQFKTTYLCLDSDEKGQLGAKKIAEKIGYKKTKNMILPTKDANEYLMTYNDPIAFQKELGKAKQLDITNVATVADIVNRLDDWLDGANNGMQGIQTRFPQFDNCTRGLKAGDLCIYSGESGIGKTTLINNFILNIVGDDVPVFYISLEGQIEYYVARMMGAFLGVPYDKLKSNAEAWEKVKRWMSERPLTFYSGPQGGLSLEQIKELIPTVVNLYDVKAVFIDNLQKVVRGSDNMYYQRLAETVSVLKDVAVDCKIPVGLIAHVTKTPDDKKVLTMHDVKGSSTIYQDADIFAIFQTIKDKKYISLEKNRMGVDGVNIEIDANAETGEFKEAGFAPIQQSEVGRTPRTIEE